MRRTPLLAALSAVAALTLVAGCGGSGSDTTDDTAAEAKIDIPAEAEPGTFSIATQPWIGYAAWYVALDKGFDKSNGVKFDQKNFTTDDQINSALAAGKVDGANVATHTALKLVEAGVPLKILWVEDVSLEADAILSGPGISGVRDLKGKKVAYEEGTTSDILLRHALGKEGMSIDDVTKVPMPAADAGTALVAGKVDAAVTYEPYISAARKEQKDLQVLFDGKRKPGLISDVFVVTEETLKEKPGQINKLLAAWNDSIEAYNSDKKGSQATIAKGVGEKPENLTTAFGGIQYYNAVENASYLPGPFRSSVLKDVAQVANEAGITKKKFSTSELRNLIVDDFVKNF